MSPLVVRERRDDDLPDWRCCSPSSSRPARYPIRWPLPIPVEEFLVRPTEERAWVAELDGRVVGHVTVGGLDGVLRDLFVAALGTEGLAEVAVLFVAEDILGTGAGGRLLDTAVDWIVASGREPVLDVVPAHARAIAVYRHRGWRVLGETRPVWLADDHPSLVLMTLSDRP